MPIVQRIKSRLTRHLLEPARKSLRVMDYHFNGGERRFHERFFADVPVPLSLMREFRNEFFPNAGPTPWLDRPDWEKQVDARHHRGELSEAQAALCRQWATDGYVVLRNPYPDGFLDSTWAAYERAVAADVVHLEPEPGGPNDLHPGRFLNPHLLVPEVKQFLYTPEVMRQVELLLGKTPAPFQTIASHKGSQQAAHSDSIHMTTYPLGFMCAAWTAFEDIHPDSGPLVYYPGSHRLPYYFSRDAGIRVGEFREKGYAVYSEKYEPFLQQRIEDLKLAPAYFHAKKGDVLVWHANLIHGGSRRNDLRHTRKAIVSHYFCVGAICYHDLAGGQAEDRHGGSYAPREA